MSRAGQYVTATIPALAILGFFVWFANWIPQSEWNPPEKLDIGASATPAELADLGETIALQRGCMACHTIEPGAGVQGGGRGPNWANIASRRAQGAGGANNLIEYLAEALFDPSAYLVEGYADIMPAATGAPAKLTYEESVAVINYLQSLGGTPSAKLGEVPEPSGGTAPQQQAVSLDGAAIFKDFKCSGCHSLQAGEIRLGPSLDAASLKNTAADLGMTAESYILESIVDPAAEEKEEFPPGVMPPDLGTQLNASQLFVLVDYLLSAGGQ